MRFDDRVTGKLEDVRVERARRSTASSIPPRSTRTCRVDVALVGDVRETLDALMPRVARATRAAAGSRGSPRSRATPRCATSSTMPHDGRLFAAHVMHDLWRITEGNALVVTDVGQHQMWEAQYYKHDHPRKLITSGGLGTMGFALPAAIGARFALPDDEVWVIAGDGGFQMTACELSTLAQEGVKLNIAIINNGYLGMVRQWQQFFYDGRYSATPLSSPDFVKLAEAHGLTGLRVTKREEVEGAVAERARAPGHRGDRLPRRAGGQRLPDGARAAPTSHDMIRRPSPIVETARGRVMTDIEARTFIMHVEDLPGVLNRVDVAVPAARLQHRIAHRRPHRRARRLAHDDRDGGRRRRRAPHRGEPLQAGQRPAGRGHDAHARSSRASSR